MDEESRECSDPEVSPKKVSMAQLWQKYSLKKKTFGGVVHRAQQHQRQKAEEGFLIRFELSKAYKSMERQETDASRPTLKPHRKRRRRRGHHHHHQQKEQQEREQLTHQVPKADVVETGATLKKDAEPNQKVTKSPMVERARNRFLSRIARQNRDCPDERNLSADRRNLTKKKSEEVVRDSRLLTVLNSPSQDFSEAVLEWERRNEARRQHHKARAEKIKSVSPAAEPSSKPPIFSRRTRSSMDAIKSNKGMTLFQKSAKVVQKINLMYPSKQKNNKKSPKASTESQAVTEEPPKSVIKNPYDIIRQMGDVNHPEHRRLLDRDLSESPSVVDEPDSPSPTTTARPKSGIGLESRNSIPNLSVKSLTKQSSRASTAWQDTTPLTQRGHSSKGNIVLFDLAKKLVKPEPSSSSKTRRQSKTPGQLHAKAEAEEPNGSQFERLKICRYFYTMCKCEKANGADTYVKLQKKRKLAGVIDIYGCPGDDAGQNMPTCPFCNVFPRQKINAWIKDVNTDLDPERIPEGEPIDNWKTQLTHAGLTKWKGYRRKNRSKHKGN